MSGEWLMSITAKEIMLKEHLEGRGVHDLEVLRAMRIVPREEFIPPELLDNAYEDYPLAIGYGQTISQPFIVAIMTQMLQILPGATLLEIGAGCGYQAAILSRIASEVHTVERIPALAELARENLSGLGYDNVHVHLGDGWNGWPPEAPYDGIIVTAAPAMVPPPLIAQLKSGGTLVIPVGPAQSVQYLETIYKEPDGTLTQRAEMAVRFVPLISPHNL